MINIEIKDRKIIAAALANKWPGLVVGCIYTKPDTRIEWDEASVSVKTADEINAAQDTWDSLFPWKEAMVETDTQLPRIAEDIIDSMESTQFDKLPKIVRDNHAAKKVLRGQKP